MKLKINRINNMKKLKLVKVGIILTAVFPFVLSGCEKVNSKDYYLVHNNGKYYICSKSSLYSNSCDYEYNSIVDDSVIGSMCSLKNNFDYQTHHLSTEFLSDLQVVRLDEVIKKNSISQNDIMSIAKSDRINEIGDEYFKSKKYYFKYESENYSKTTLKVYKMDDRIILGYDMSPERLNGTNDYVYSINDNDVLNLSNYSVDVYDVSEYYSENEYITYDTVLELSKDKKLQKVLKK